MSAEDHSRDDRDGPTDEDGKVTRKRRKRTKAERAASFEKRLRDEYGDSRLDPREPPLHGLTAAIILCAITLLRKACRSGGGFKPASIADTTARICSLTEEQRKVLLRWLVWVKPRRFVIEEKHRSPVVAWSNSEPEKKERWSAQLEEQWRARIERAAAQDENEAASSNRSTQPSEPTRSSVTAPQGRTVETQTHGEPARAYESEWGLSAMEGPDRPAPGVPDFVFPELPDGAFKKGAWEANAFFDAIQKRDKNKLKTSVLELSSKPMVVDEICSRSTAHRACIESAFKHFGVPLP